MDVPRIARQGEKVRLGKIDTRPPDGFSKPGSKEKLAAIGEELFELQDLMWGARSHSLLIVLQGRDAAGKDGAIKRVCGAFNPRGVHVISYGVPTEEERQHDFLWRIHRHAPRLGEVAVFNRSHYEDVLVARVAELVPEETWKARYGQIRAFEELLCASNTLLVKFFLHISPEEQEERLLDREKEARAHWKLSIADWEDRARWDDYTAAYQDAISETASERAPWTIVPSDAKWYRNLVVAEAIAEVMRPHAETWRERLLDRGKQLKKQLASWRKRD